PTTRIYTLSLHDALPIFGLEMHYVAKKELFDSPFGWWFRWMGGAPLDRSGSLNTVDAIVRVFQSREVFRMAIAPEGTRKKVNELDRKSTRLNSSHVKISY